jgi:hypothetical protein
VAAAAIAGLALAAVTDGQTRRWGARRGIVVYQHEGFRGRSASFRRDVPDLRRFGMDDRISSLRIARGDAWEVCEHPNYEGRCEVFSGDEPDLRRSNWEDRISSLRRARGRGRPGEGYPEEQGGLILYSDTGYRGDVARIRSGVADMRTIGFDDRAESVRMGRGTWELCEHPNFRNCRLVDRDVPDLREIGLSRRITSARPAPPRWRE